MSTTVQSSAKTSEALLQAQDLHPPHHQHVLPSLLVGRNSHQHHHQDAVEKIMVKVAAATHIVAVIGTTLDTETDVGDNPE